MPKHLRWLKLGISSKVNGQKANLNFDGKNGARSVFNDEQMTYKELNRKAT
jgi:hypothetical protein